MKQKYKSFGQETIDSLNEMVRKSAKMKRSTVRRVNVEARAFPDGTFAIPAAINPPYSGFSTCRGFLFIFDRAPKAKGRKR